MAELLIRYLKICLLSLGPQDLPYSHGLMRLTLLLYFVTGLLLLSTMMSIGQALPVMSVEFGLMLLYAGIMLKAFHKSQRFVQMVTAMAGISTLFQLLEWPLHIMLASARTAEQLAPEASVFLLVLVSWNLAVFAHIFRESFEIRLLSAFLLTVAFAIINITVHQMLFKDLGV